MLKTRKRGIVWLTGLPLLFLIVLLAVGVSQAKMIEIQGKKYDIAQPGEFKPGEIVVKGHPETSKEAVHGLAAQMQARVKAHIPEYNLYLLVLPPQAGEAAQKAQMGEAVQTLERFSQVKAAFPNFKFSIPKPPEAAALKSGKKGDNWVPGAAPKQALTALGLGLSSYQWHLDKIKFNNAGAAPIAASAPKVAVLDTGVDYTHPDLASNVVNGPDYIDGDNDPMDENGHGTHVAGLIAASSTAWGSGITGISPTSKVLAVRVLDQLGSGTWFQVIQGVVYAMKSDAKILNLSLGGYDKPGSGSYVAFKQAIDDCVAAGKIVCVAAGNEANTKSYKDIHSYAPPNSVPVPAWFPNSFTVAASEQNDCRAYFSNYDVGTLRGVAYNFDFVDIVAPGWNILSTIPLDQWNYTGIYGNMSGTSMATPIIAGCAARVWAKYPAYTKTQVQNLLISTGLPVTTTNGFYKTEKRVDLMKALGLNATGFTGVVYDGQRGAALSGVKVVATPSGKTAYTNGNGFFTMTGLTAATTYSLAFSKTGFSSSNLTGQVAKLNKINDLFMPTHLNKVQADGKWSILFSHRTFHPGLTDSQFSPYYGWWPVPWDSTQGLYFTPRLAKDSVVIVEPRSPGNLGKPPYAALTNDGWKSTSGSQNIVISQVASGSTYRIWTRLDNEGASYGIPEWGSYKGAGQGLKAQIYSGATLKGTAVAASATGAGTYWWVGDMKDGTLTIKNKLGTYPPPF